MDLQSLQQYLQQNLAQLQSQILKHQQLTESLYRDEELVKQRVERRRGELERRTARLKSMMAVRPAFMDDYEKLESQLKQIYAIYVESLRNLAYLEYQLEQHDQKELESLQVRLSNQYLISSHFLGIRETIEAIAAAAKTGRT